MCGMHAGGPRRQRARGVRAASVCAVAAVSLGGVASTMVLSQCGNVTELVVVVDGDYAPAVDVDTLRVRVVSSESAEEERSLALDANTTFPLTLGISSQKGGRVTVTVTAARGDRVVATRVRNAEFVRDESRALVVPLCRACTDASCGAPEEVAGVALPRWTGTPPRARCDVPRPEEDGGTDGGGAPLLAIAAGRHNTCVLGEDGGVRCWGGNRFATLGNGRSDNASVESLAVPGPTVPELFASQVAVRNHACAIVGERTLCWGLNDSGQVGRDSSLDQDAGPGARCAGNNLCVKAPFAVPDLLGATRVSMGTNFTCALREGRVGCWGSADFGASGARDASSPVPAWLPLEDVVAIASLDDATCAQRAGDDGLHCWGRNRYAELGAPWDADGHPMPSRVAGLSAVASIATGEHHACVIHTDRGVSCWGFDGYQVAGGFGGQLGHAVELDQACSEGRLCNPTPTRVEGLTGVRELALGFAHSCALLEDGTVRCWGEGSSGRLGRPVSCGSTCANPAPQPVVGLSEVEHIAAGEVHTCALTRRREIWCWGGSESRGANGSPNFGINTTPVRIEN